MKSRVWERYTKAAERLNLLGDLLFEAREELEYITVENADELYAKTEEALREYEDALQEYRICDYAGNYTNVIDSYFLNTQREMMIKIMRCIANTNEWTHEQVAKMAQDFLNTNGLT